MEKEKSLGKLSNLQLELLKVFSQNLDDTQLLEIRELLANYFSERTTNEMDKLFSEKNWGAEKIEEWASDHMRTKYEKK
ncbi:hypothetical protein SAMN04489724_1363 [Algoriphagus locisalis]|uniref:Uncharacterized protein n=1 Tax=Algoriphagus locisalis TaxID=305507 RepID=A0A1I6Z1R9_9BACT|nr:hypothetical protein [Algoriphagus locisalis]SFT56548.1 hypothetical protein SAMN04489724_1363 [Algoriphagus locisalis]